jgi:NAD(P)-dependent dehydrogenase (short-subunit alcohol dehydrogenase family)
MAGLSAGKPLSKEIVMPHHPALAPGRAAVITGAASGIGLAVAEKLAALGMNVCLADIDEAALKKAAARVAKASGEGGSVIAVQTAVSKADEVERLRDRAVGAFGEVAFLMNNAGIGGGGGLFDAQSRLRQIVDVNLWGVVNGIQAFAPLMRTQGTHCAIVNTGSKQGITCPPGDTAYNVSKAGVKVVTEALAHELRNMDGCKLTAHLLIPGFTFTGMTQQQMKPDAAWTAGQVTEFMLEKMAAGDFYILCPDNSVAREVDELRVLWAAGDIVENRPALSRWHKDYEAKFADFLEAGLNAKAAS